MKKIFLVVLLSILALSYLFAKEQYTGWKKIHTEHFTIVYEEKSRESALEIAGFCEEVYTKVTGFFHSYPENILCILHDRIDTSNGNFYPLPLELNLYVTSPSTPLIGARNGNWLKLLLTHELTHYVNLTYHGGLFYHLSKLLGKSVSVVPATLMPGWAMEGIAVKLETELTEGGRGRNPFFEMEYKAQSIDNAFYSWKQAAYPSIFPPYDRIYQAGYLINDYLSRTYGNDIFVRIYKKYTAFPLCGFDSAVKAVTGSSVKNIFTAMKKELKKKYTPLRSTFGSLVSPDIIGNYYLPVITDKGWILYRSSQDFPSALVLFNPESGKESILKNTYLHDYASFTADRTGNTVVFASFDAKENTPAGYTLTSDLFLIHPGNKKVLRLTTDQHLWQPALSPDGRQLVAVQKRGQYSALVIIDRKTGNVSSFFSRPDTNIHTPSFSPDGEKIVFSVNSGGKQEIAILNRSGKAVFITTSLEGEKYFPRFITNRSIIFSADTGGNLALYRYTGKPASGTGIIEKICDDPVGAYAGTISHSRIVYASYSPKGYCLREKPLPGGNTSIEEKPLPVFSSYKENPNRINETTYTDFPKLIFWLPAPFSLDPLDPGNISFAPGAVFSFLSPMGKTSILGTLSLLTDPLQPEGSLTLGFSAGIIQIRYTLNQGYSKQDGNIPAVQTTLQNFSMTLPIIQRNYLGIQRSLSATAGVLDSYSLYAPYNFPLFSVKTPLLSLNTLYINTGVNADIERAGSIRDIIPPQKLDLASSFYFPLNRKGSPFPGWKGRLSLSVPSLFKHQVIRFENKWGFSTDSNLALLPTLRGGMQGTGNMNGGLIAGIDYLFTMGIMDIPLFNGFSLQGLAGGFHIEKDLGFSLFPHKFEIDKHIYLGTELTFKMGYMTVIGTGGIGINCRIDPENPGTFSLLKDTGVYLYFGTDSFKSGSK